MIWNNPDCDLFGKYCIEGRLGKGGMAEVYIARDPVLNRRVAIKVILGHLVSGSSFIDRFMLEARVIAGLRHPNIVQIYDFAEFEDKPYMVVEYLEGGTLKDRLMDARRHNHLLPFDEIAAVMESLCSAVEYSHRLGVIHRDLKPANILFDADGRPVLTDFGIARLLSETLNLTATGSLLGTPAYMSPEQAAGIPIEPASDLYSLGIILYEMAAGRVPFIGKNATATLIDHISTPPPSPRKFNPSLPPKVEQVILKSIQKSPGSRFASVSEMASALRASLADQGSGAVSFISLPKILPQTSPPEAALDEQMTVADTAAHFSQPTEVEPPPEPPLPNIPFLGRQVEMAALFDLLANADCRLITVTGPGGVGKTTFVQEALRCLEQQPTLIELFPGGVISLSLETMQDLEALFRELALAAGLSGEGTGLKQKLLETLPSRSALLIIDHLENLPSARSFFLELVARAPGSKIILVSLERLDVREEWLLKLAGFTFPDQLEPTPDNDAARLFEVYAQLSEPSFAVTPDNASQVAEISRLLQGSPLALRLAACRTARHTLEEIAADLQTNLDRFICDHSAVVERQRSFRAAFDRTWQLLNTFEKDALARLAVFEDGFSRESAAQVAHVYLPQILSLKRKHLLLTGPGHRYSLPVPLRAFAREKLLERVPDPGELSMLRQRHSTHFAAFAAVRLPGLMRSSQDALDEIKQEEGNLMAAWNEALAIGDFQALPPLMEALYRYFRLQSRFPEGARWLSQSITFLQGLPVSPGDESRSLLGMLLVRQGDFLLRLGNFQPARESLDEALRMLHSPEEDAEVASAHNILGLQSLRQGDLAQAVRQFELSLNLAGQSGNEWGMQDAFSNLGMAVVCRGDLPLAQSYFEQALLLAQKVEDSTGAAVASVSLGMIAAEQGDNARASSLYHESLPALSQSGDRSGMASLLSNQARLAFLQKDYHLARQVYLECLALRREIGESWGLAAALAGLGETDIELEIYDEAAAFYEEAHQIFDLAGNLEMVSECAGRLELIQNCLCSPLPAG